MSGEVCSPLAVCILVWKVLGAAQHGGSTSIDKRVIALASFCRTQSAWPRNKWKYAVTYYWHSSYQSSLLSFIPAKGLFQEKICAVAVPL